MAICGWPDSFPAQTPVDILFLYEKANLNFVQTFFLEVTTTDIIVRADSNALPCLGDIIFNTNITETMVFF